MNTPHRIIVLAMPELPSMYLTAFTEQNATVIPYEPPPLSVESGGGYYRNVLLKLVSFKLHHYIPALKRVLVLDADQLVLQSLDHLFDLPAVDVAMPHSYWEGPGKMTSAMMLVSLSDRLWNIMDDGLKTIATDVYDMDLVNQLFIRTAMVLPGDYCTLNSHWETNDLPRWWRGDSPPERNSSWLPPPFQEPNHNYTKMDDKMRAQTQKQLEWDKQIYLKLAEMLERRNRTSELLVQAYHETKVLHFTAVGKPWMHSVASIAKSRPGAHYLLAEQFGVWWEEARAVCPGKWDPAQWEAIQW